MKKQLSILVTTFSIVALVSCSKEKIETQQPNNLEETATAKGGGANGLPPVSNKGLLGRFEFNNNLKDATVQLADGVSTVNRVLYTADRKGMANRAIRFNQAYGVDIFDVPSSSEASLSVWVKHDLPASPNWHLVLMSWQGFILQQLQTTFNFSFDNGISFQGVYAGPVDNKWHHMAVTRDSNEFKFYIDGILIGTSPTPAGSGPNIPLNHYKLAYGNGIFWQGALDDLRFYERILSADEVNTLANL
jgi:hypothetical protein